MAPHSAGSASKAATTTANAPRVGRSRGGPGAAGGVPKSAPMTRNMSTQKASGWLTDCTDPGPNEGRGVLGTRAYVLYVPPSSASPTGANSPRDTKLAQKVPGPQAGLTHSLSGVLAVPARGPATESLPKPDHNHGGLTPASNSRGFWKVPVGHIRVVLSLGRFTRGTTPSNGHGRAG